MGTPQETRRAEQQEIAHRYRKRAKRRPDISAIRLRDLNRLLTARHGREALPDTPDTRRAVTVIAHHLAALGQDPRRSIPSWISLRAPWMTMGDTNALVLDVTAKTRRWRAASLGWALKLSGAERKALRITTIAAYDVSPAERTARRKADARDRERARRRRRGTKPRAEYLAAIAADKPWRALGMSRRTWYRKGKPRL